MRFRDDTVNRGDRYSIGTEERSRKHYLGIPVSNGIIDYEERYETDAATFERFRRDAGPARSFAEQCRRGAMDHGS